MFPLAAAYAAAAARALDQPQTSKSSTTSNKIITRGLMPTPTLASRRRALLGVASWKTNGPTIAAPAAAACSTTTTTITTTLGFPSRPTTVQLRLPCRTSRMIEEHEANAARQAKEEAEKKQRIIDQYHKDKKDAAEKARAAEEALKIKMEKEAKEAAEKAKQEEEEYERKRLAKIEKEKKEKAEADEKFEKEMHERLHKMGFSEEQIQAMIKGEKAKENNQVIVNVGGHRHHRHGIPTYIKIHKNHLEVATLTYFGLPWEYDRADSDYIIILKEMDHNETEVLFEHTKSLRRRTTLRIEERPRASGKPELMWVRRRGRSKSAVRNIHIKDTFF
ncbi:hypothetical protein IWZ00DRAFT_262030 [Phyllosticta capitalensis]